MDYSTSALEQFVEHSKTLLYVECDKRWNMISHNAYLQELAVGAIEDDFTSMLLPESKEQLLRQKHDGKLILQFSNRHKGAVAVECTLFFEKDRRVIIGERPQLVNIDILNSMSKMQNELVNLTRDLKKKNAALEEAQNTIRTLRGIIPICSFCKGIRNDSGYWKQLEEYIEEMTEAEFSHSICPDCLEKHYPELMD